MEQELIKSIKDSLEEIVQSSDNKEIFETISKLMTMPDEEFVVIAPNILQSFQQSLNNPTDKIALAQSLNASGIRADELVSNIEAVMEEINKLSVSVQKRDFLKEIISSLVNTINDTEGIAKRYVSIPIEFCNENAKMPQYAHLDDSGMDVYALDDVTIHPGETVLVPTGIKIALPPGFEVQVRPKSGRALKTKLRVANTPGTIDAGYRDEIKVIVENIEAPIKDITIEDGKVTSILYGSDFTIGKGEKFAQLVLMEVPKAAFYQVDSVQELGEDRGGGFGSSGIK